jgi:hypothetical protein
MTSLNKYLDQARRTFALELMDEILGYLIHPLDPRNRDITEPHWDCDFPDTLRCGAPYVDIAVNIKYPEQIIVSTRVRSHEINWCFLESENVDVTGIISWFKDKGMKLT